jgi:hypothetical protein
MPPTVRAIEYVVVDPPAALALEVAATGRAKRMHGYTLGITG